MKKSCGCVGYFFSTLVLIGCVSSAVAEPVKELIKFSNIKAISQAVTQTQCQELFLPFTSVQVNGTIASPISISPLHTLISLEKIRKSGFHKDKSRPEFFSKWAGESEVSFDNGKSFTKMKVVAKGKTVKLTQVTTGQIRLGDRCLVDFEAIPAAQ